MYRLTENDTRIGPLVFGPTCGGTWSIMFSTGDDEYPGNCLMLWCFGRVFLLKLPAMVKPYRRWVSLEGEEWAESSGYWETWPREYGIRFSDGDHFQIMYGAQTDESRLERRWSCLLPWMQWRQVRHSLYNLEGGEIWRGNDWKSYYEASKACPRAAYLVEDYDGEQVTAFTLINEREWWLGEGWFRWLAWFRRRKICRSLDISFQNEVGPEKGSWKGGLIGHSIDMLPGELHEDAFRRYCEKEHNAKGRRYRIKFVKKVTT